MMHIPDIFPYTRLTAFILAILIVIVTAGGCADKTNVEALEAKIITPGNDVNIKEGESIFFQGYASGGVPPYSYFWYFESGAPDSENQNTGEVFLILKEHIRPCLPLPTAMAIKIMPSS